MNRVAFLQPTKQPPAKVRMQNKRVDIKNNIRHTTNPKGYKPSIYPGLEAPAFVCLATGQFGKEREKNIDRILDLGYDYTDRYEKADIVVYEGPMMFGRGAYHGGGSQPTMPSGMKHYPRVITTDHMFFQGR
jgi:hypothetical protein